MTIVYLIRHSKPLNVQNTYTNDSLQLQNEKKILSMEGEEIIEYAGNNLKNKYNFLYEKLDFIEPQNYIFTADKSIVNCDIKIDDKVNNIEGAETKLLFTAWHNKDITDEELKKQSITRVNNWKEIGEILQFMEFII